MNEYLVTYVLENEYRSGYTGFTMIMYGNSRSEVLNKFERDHPNWTLLFIEAFDDLI